MKNIYTILAVLLFTQIGFGQCYPDRHNSTWYDGWISCTMSQNPNPDRDSSHWIMYSFDNLLEMYELSIWNINAPDILHYGMKTAYIDYSLDGINWVNFDSIVIGQGIGENHYEGQQLLDFDGEIARYLLITSVESYGSNNCTGFAEMKLMIDYISDYPLVSNNDPTGLASPVDSTLSINEQNPNLDDVLNDSICLLANVYPNPMQDNKLFVALEQQCASIVYYSLTDVTGKMLISKTPIAYGETIEILDGTKLAKGVYIVEVSSETGSQQYKVVKN